MENICIKIDSSLKTIEINKEGKNYICQIEVIEELIQANLFLDKKIKFRGIIFLEKIQSQIKAFFDYNINEIFEEINQLNPKYFSIIKEKNKYKLKIEFIILRKKRNIIIDLNETKIKEDINNINYENMIKEKDNIIFALQEKIKKENNDIINNYENIIKEKDNLILELKKEIKNKNDDIINKYENVIKEKDSTIFEFQKKLKMMEEKINNNLYNNFNINIKNPIHKLNSHTKGINCLALLNDGRLVSGSSDNKIIIYNKITYKPDIIINEHKESVNCIIVLSTGILASCSRDKTIKFFKINENNYETIQTLNNHKDWVYKIIELKNKDIISCSKDRSIIFYFNEKSKYQEYYRHSANYECKTIAQIKEKEICYAECFDLQNYNICFLDLNEKKKKSSISNISISGSKGPFNMITKDLLLIGGENRIFIINVNKYELVRTVEVQNSSWIFGFCFLNDNIFLTGDYNKAIMQWKIEGDNIIFISKKEKAHNGYIYTLINIGNGNIASGSSDKSIIIW